MKTLFIGLFVVLSSILVSLGAAFLARKHLRISDVSGHHSVADPMLGVVGTLFSVLLGFLVAGAMGHYEQARSNVDAEANSVADMFRIARGLPEQERKRLRQSCRQYAAGVIDVEWPQMEERQMSPQVWDVYQDIWDETLSFKPADQRQSNLHQALMSSVQTLGENRRSRTVAARAGMSTALWIVTLAGAAITLAFTCLFVGTGTAMQAVMIALVAMSLCLNIFLLHIYSTPFSGDMKITPYSFQLDTELFKQNDDPPKFLPK